MSHQAKLLRRFLSRPNDFTYDELIVLLRGFGYQKMKSGKTAGSRIAFINERSKHIIRLHRPHPNNTLKIYQILELEKELKLKGFIR
jgi:hypothetical protein